MLASTAIRRGSSALAAAWVDAFEQQTALMRKAPRHEERRRFFNASLAPAVAPLLDRALQHLQSNQVTLASALAAEVEAAVPLAPVSRLASTCWSYGRGASAFDTLLSESVELHVRMTPVEPLRVQSAQHFAAAIFCHWGCGLELSSHAVVDSYRALDACAEANDVASLPPRALCQAVAWLGGNAATHRSSFRALCKALLARSRQPQGWGKIRPPLAVATAMALRESDLAPDLGRVVERLSSHALRQGLTRGQLHSLATSVDLMRLDIPWIRALLQKEIIEKAGLIDIPRDGSDRYLRRGTVSDESADFIALTNDGTLDMDNLKTNYRLSEEDIASVLNAIEEEKQNWKYSSG